MIIIQFHSICDEGKLCGNAKECQNIFWLIVDSEIQIQGGHRFIQTKQYNKTGQTDNKYHKCIQNPFKQLRWSFYENS